MDAEAASVFEVATESMGIVLHTLHEWATTTLEGPERDEAVFHIIGITKAYDRFTLAIGDYEGMELWRIPQHIFRKTKPFTLEKILSQV